MMTSQVLLGVTLFAWLILDAQGLSLKGLQSQHQSHSGTSAGGEVASRRAGSGSGGPAGVFMRQPSQPQVVQPMFVGVSSIPGAGYSTGSVPAGYSTGSVPAGYSTGSVPAGYSTGSVPAGYYSGASYIRGSAAGSPQAPAGHGQSSLPEAKWTIVPQAFEAASSAQPQGSSALVPPPGSPPMTLQSGETSNVVMDAELGSYQQQMAASGYPAGQRLPFVPTPNLGVGGLWGYPSPYLPACPYPYPYFDYRLLYGLYPPGIYTTLSRNPEKGKGYYQTSRYLKGHVSDAAQMPQSPGTGQQKS